MTSERLYNDDEVAAIIEKATRVEDRPGSSGGALPGGESGMTLAEIQRIGSEVGISPDVIARSAQSLTTGDQGATEVTRRFMGLPLGVGGSATLPRPLTDQEWAQLVVQVREHFNAHGKLDEMGGLRSWRNGNLRVQLEPSPDGQRIRVQTYKDSARQMMMVGAGMLGGSGFLALTAYFQVDASALRGAMAFLPIGGGFLGSNLITLRGWAARRRAQMEEVMAQAVALASRTLPGANRGSEQLGDGNPTGPGGEG